MNTITLSLWKFNKKTTDESIVHYFNNYYYHRGEVFGGGDVVAIVHLNNCSKTPSSKPRKAFFLNHFKTKYIMKVLKFGGTSVGTVDSIKTVLHIIKQSYENNEKPLVVLSAMSAVTNLLTQMAENAAEGQPFDEALATLEARHFEVVKTLIAVKHQNPVFTKLKLMLNDLDEILQGVYALRELSPQSKDLIVAFGERFSNYMMAKIMEQEIPEATYIDASHYMKTDSNFGNAQLDEVLSTQLIQSLAQSHRDKLLFVTGFIGSNEKG